MKKIIINKNSIFSIKIIMTHFKYDNDVTVMTRIFGWNIPVTSE